MYTTTIMRVLPLIFIFSLAKTCMAQDWARPLEASTAPTDYQEVLEQNLATYTPPAAKVEAKANLATYENSLSQNVQTITTTTSATKPFTQSWNPATVISTITIAVPELITLGAPQTTSADTSNTSNQVNYTASSNKGGSSNKDGSSKIGGSPLKGQLGKTNWENNIPKSSSPKVK